MFDFITWAFNVAQHGFGFHAIAFGLLTSLVGAFFFTSGVNKLFNPGRHKTIVSTLKADHIPFLKFNQWFVPGTEFVGGFMLMFGLLPTIAATALFILLGVAAFSEARQRVDSYAPINMTDRVCCYLYLPEIIYLIILGYIILQ